MENKLRYRIRDIWSKWIYFTSKDLRLPDTIEALEVHEVITKSQFKKQFPKEYKKFFEDGLETIKT